jgi:hypothetical protein
VKVESLHHVSCELKALAEEVEGLHLRIILPQESMSIPDAIAKLQAALLGRHFSLKWEIDVWEGIDTPSRVHWEVYDSNCGEGKFYRAATLVDAVNHCLAAVKPGPDTPPEQLIHGLQSAMLGEDVDATGTSTPEF